ncbi:MAG: DNA helicase PcrA [Bacillota bacterium]
MNNLLEGLNPTQREAVEHTEGPLLILAGAGSGKTRVLTHRVAYLVREKAVFPYRILAITFTNKAAGQMKERLEGIIGEAARETWVSTFHAACVRILRREIQALGYERNFIIYDDADQQAVVKNCLKELNYDEKKFTPRSVAGTISAAKNGLLNPSQYEQQVAGYYEKNVAEVYRLYQRKLREANALDFDDLIMFTVALFRDNQSVLEQYQDRFRYILVDEYQDTNHAQYMLVKQLAAIHRNLCVVGDPDQSIYRWRGADIRNILEFEKDYPDARVILLEENYRSTGNILEAANKIITNNTDRKEKSLWTKKPKGDPLIHRLTGDEREEARYVAEEIIQLRYRGASYSSVAVLYRTHAQSRALEECFVKEGVPYEIVGGVKFYLRKEIKDILSYLRIVLNPDDPISLERVINVPKRGIGDVTWTRLEEQAATRGISVYQAMRSVEELSGFSPRIAGVIKEFTGFVDCLIDERDKLPVTGLVERILHGTGYWLALERERSVEASDRLENLKEFLAMTSEYDLNSDGSLEGFLEQVALVADIDSYQSGGDAVVMMTLHTAKGLEFPVVFLVGMEEGVFPHNRALLEPEELEEERRLCYVGMTRAKERLYLTYAQARRLYGGVQYNLPSRFLKEIFPRLTETEERDQEANEKESPVLKIPIGNSAFQIEGFRAGDRVHHAKFGTGVVVGVKGMNEDAEIAVAFPDLGIKYLINRYARLKKLDGTPLEV